MVEPIFGNSAYECINTLQSWHMWQLAHCHTSTIFKTLNLKFLARSESRMIMEGPYIQTTVCKGVQGRLKKLFPGASCHSFSSCVRCEGLKKDEECRFKREYRSTFCETFRLFTFLKDFRQFSLQGDSIIVSFCEPVAKTNMETATLPPLWNKNLASEPLYLRSLEVSLSFQYIFSC